MLPARCMMLPCMKIPVSSVSQTGIGVGSSPGMVTSTTLPCTGTRRTDGSVTMSRPVTISAGTCT